MRQRPLLLLAVAFAAGAALPAFGRSATALGVAAAIALPLACARYTAPIAFLVAGWAAASFARAPAHPALLPGAERVIEGRVASVPERLDDRVRFLLRERGGALVLATSPPLPWPLALGDRLRLSARLRVPEGARNPRGRDRAEDLAVRGVGLEAHASAPPVRVAPPSPLAAIEAGRGRFAEGASRALPPREAALVRAIGAGDRGAVDAATSDAFARSGLAHLLSVSGLHLAVVAYGAFRIARALAGRWDALSLRADPRRIAAAAALPVTALYALATGADVPVVRS
ncbi:MAG: ComEC/Rec2 family competence protein, partial [Anaeromyxobacteraceae bacterium]